MDTAKSRSREIGLVLIFSLGMCLGPQGLLARVKPSSGFNMFSAQEEIQAGQQAATDATKQLPILWCATFSNWGRGSPRTLPAKNGRTTFM